MLVVDGTKENVEFLMNAELLFLKLFTTLLKSKLSDMIKHS
jgi:hypothetical protein